MSINFNLKKLKPSVHTEPNNHYGFWRLLNLIVSGSLIVGMMLSVFFIYRNVDKALTDTATIVNIKSQITFDVLDTKTYQETREAIDGKEKIKPIPADIRFVFDYQTATTTYESTTTTIKKE